MANPTVSLMNTVLEVVKRKGSLEVPRPRWTAGFGRGSKAREPITYALIAIDRLPPFNMLLNPGNRDTSLRIQEDHSEDDEFWIYTCGTLTT